uniref:Uncharacterized protein n=1 Tax=Anopheles quadriannulatus TaxID=34691 RepID=A0A182XRF5_ANOQN
MPTQEPTTLAQCTSASEELRRWIKTRNCFRSGAAERDFL